MSAQSSRFAKLIDLASAQSSDQRRELLREVSDLFFETANERTEREAALFDEVLRTVASDMEESVLAELAGRFSNAVEPPRMLMRDLSMKSFPIAEKVLRRCTSLSDDDLIRVIQSRSQMHVRAVAQREIVSERLSDAIVERADDNTLDTLIRNKGAALSRNAMEVVVDRAQNNTDLHEGVVKRADLPLDLLNEMYFVVEKQLRDSIMQRNASVDQATLDAALANTRRKMKQADEQVTEQARAAAEFIEKKKKARELNGQLLVSLFREKQLQKFYHGLGELTGVEPQTAREIITRKDFDALATICRASNLERPLFVTLCVLCMGSDDAMKRAEEFGKIYAAVPVEAAQRAMRFFKVRKATESATAAA